MFGFALNQQSLIYHLGAEASVRQLSYKCKAKRRRLLQQVLFNPLHRLHVILKQPGDKNNNVNMPASDSSFSFSGRCCRVVRDADTEKAPRRRLKIIHWNLKQKIK